jgi:CRP/FNR family transcriptional regulator, cyclic AMP receptor protein
MQTLLKPNADSLHDLVAGHPMFSGFPAEHLATLTACASDIRFGVGEIIFSEGQPADRFYLIREGQVALEVFCLEGGPLTIDTLTEGDVLGWSWLVPPYRWRFDARSISHTHAAALDGAHLRRECERTPALGYELLKRFALVLEQRLQSTRLHLLDLHTLSR